MRSLAASLAVTTAFSLAFARPARAEDTVRTCIAASTDGQTQRNAGKLLAARASMLSCARDVCPAVVRSHCARWLTELEAQIPTVVVRAQKPDGEDALAARVAIDGRPVILDGKPVPLDPGAHVVTMDAVGSPHIEQRVLIVEGESSRLITLREPAIARSSDARAGVTPIVEGRPDEAPAARSVPAGAWVLGGIGVAALAGSGVFALLAHHDLANLDSTCSPHCTQAQTNPGRTNATITYVLLASGGVAVTAAVVWALAFPSHSAPHPVGLLPHLTLAAAPTRGGAVSSLALSF